MIPPPSTWLHANQVLRSRLPQLYLLVAGLGGVALCFLTPPLQVPDEDAHFARIYHLSEGNLLAEPRSGRLGAELPASLGEFAAQAVGDLPKHPERKTSRANILALGDIALEPDVRKRTAFTGAAFYTPVPYAPQIVAITAGRWLRLPPLVLMYLGRLAALACALGLVFLAMRRYEPTRVLVLALALMPTTLFLAASLSADSVTTGLALLWTASVLHHRAGAHVGRRGLIALAVLLSALALCKQVYGLLGALAVLIPASAFGSPKRKWLSLGALAGVAVLLTMAWSSAVGELAALPTKRSSGLISAPDQMAWIFAHPTEFVRTMARGLAEEATVMLRGMVGILGWADTRVSLRWVLPYGALLFLAGVSVPVSPTPRLRERALLAALAVGCVLLTAVLLFVTWRPVGGSLQGMQGRYLIPVALLALLSVQAPRYRELDPLRLADWAVVVFALLSPLVTLFTVLRRFYD